MIHGVDLASFQQGPDHWANVAGDIGFAAVKFTEVSATGSRYVNPDAPADWAWLARHRMARIAYLFGHPASSVAETVEFFAEALSSVGGIEDGDAIALDLEVSDGRSPAEVSAWARTVLTDLRLRYGRLPLLYTFRSFAQAGNCAGLGSYPLWISDPSHPAALPAVPAPWKTWAIHQYGITGAIDRDVAGYPTAAAMSAALGKRRPAPPPAPKTEVRHMTGQITGSKLDIVLPDGVTSVRFGCSQPATITVDLRHAGTKNPTFELTNADTRTVAIPAGVHMIVVHVTKPAVDGTAISFAY